MKNIYDYLIVTLLLFCIVIAIIEIRKGKGKCAYCKLNENCPIKRIKK